MSQYGDSQYGDSQYGERDGDGPWRVEHDSMGDVRVPAAALWGAQTQRAVENFPISGLRVDRALVVALAALKGAAARVNGELGVIEADVAEALYEAAVEVEGGRHFDQFPVDVFQTGSGTSTNMNMNEVLASLAAERLGRPVHPNGSPNASQSSNDLFPSAIHLAAATLVVSSLLPALGRLEQALSERAAAFVDVVKAGRTHLMDATPVTLGQELSGYASQVHLGVERLRSCLVRLTELPLGGTAVGTGLNAPPEFAQKVLQLLGSRVDLPLTEARNHFESQGARDALVECSAMLRSVAISLYKVANDLRLMSSGPRCGLAEIRLPDLQPGSSIMPGKVNPVVPEAVCQVVAQVFGNDAAVAFAGSAGTLELNVMMPVMARNVLESIRLLASASKALAEKCVAGMTADEERCRTYALSSPAVATSLNPRIGYEAAAEVVKTAMAEGKDLHTVVVESGLLTAEEADAVLDVRGMARGGLIG